MTLPHDQGIVLIKYAFPTGIKSLATIMTTLTSLSFSLLLLQNYRIGWPYTFLSFVCEASVSHTAVHFVYPSIRFSVGTY